MSNRKLRTITISATMQHEALGLRARPPRRRKRPPFSTERVRQHRERRRQGVATPVFGELRGLAYARDWNHDRALRTATDRHSVARCQRRRARE
jgi:hypothetical protein